MKEDKDNLEKIESEHPVEQDAGRDEMGDIKVADEVLSIVAGLAASEVNGVYAMSGGIREGLTDMLGKQNFSKGIKVETEGHSVRVEVHVIITYGYNIPDVAIKLQEKVKESVEAMTGFEVTAVDIHVEGVKKEKNKELIAKDDTEELMKKWEEEPVYAAKQSTLEAPKPGEKVPDEAVQPVEASETEAKL